ncbi:hypothetical protein DPMN_159566 [Dreissena polymorpha]|uniref:Amine oxidase domain-containing protein n=2 Tax=Dreissena polymorpha TaxID=45954 RepID=A0A9D4EPE2_DREPO|nr:hypothetical protein DPMN_159566 [Dreissena polymorpha]
MYSANNTCGGRSLHFWKKQVKRSNEVETFIQQDDLFKERMECIYEGGLRYAWAMEYDNKNAKALYKVKVEPANVQNVIVVGAGISGLVIAYELAQIGHNVTILELQNRVGGRIKTFYHGFADGQHSDGGAMRLPPNHFLTHHYCEHFGIEMRRFQNYQPNAYMYLYGHKIKMGDFQERNGYYSDKFWKGWDETCRPVKKKLKIKGILDYFEQTITPVMRELGHDPTEEDWTRWVDKWSKLSTEDFLRSETYARPDKLKLQPWPGIAIDGYKVSSYSPNISGSLVDTLRDILGGWWRDKLQTPKDGMSALPNAFLHKNAHGWNLDVELRNKVVYGFKVQSITKEPKLNVSGTNVITGKAVKYQCDAVFVTVPLNILRQIDIPFLCKEKRQAIAGVTYDTGTKIMLQCKERFWQKDVGKGGFSKTSDLIGQLHYPDDDKSDIPDYERGILMVYSWAQDALALGSQSHEEAIATAVSEISKIHPEMKDWFEVGKVQAWYSDPAAQGGYAALKPYEYLQHLQSLWKSEHPLYLAGEAISWSNAWIQGALFSGLSQAFAFQCRMEGVKECQPWKC